MLSFGVNMSSEDDFGRCVEMSKVVIMIPSDDNVFELFVKS